MKRLLQQGFAATVASAGLVIAPVLWAQDSSVDDDFVRPRSEAASDATAVELPTRGDASANGVGNDWIREESDRTAQNEPVPPRRQPPEERGLDRARERADEHASEALDEAAERAEDNEMDRAERAKDRPGPDHTAARAAERRPQHDSSSDH